MKSHCLNRRTLTLDLSVHKDLLQVLSVLTMERPVSFAAEDVRDEKVRRNVVIAPHN